MDIRQFVSFLEGPRDVPPENVPLVEKYRPRASTDVITNDISYLCIRQWISKFRGRDETIKKMLLISGPSGIGKSLLARLLLQEAGYTVFDLAAKTKAELAAFFDLVSMNASTSAVLIDDLDSLLASGQGLVAEVLKTVNPLKGKRTATKAEKERYKKSFWIVPVVALCTRHEYGRVADIARACDVVAIRRPPRARVEAFLAKVAAAEGMRLSPDCIKHISKTCLGDIRQTLLQLDLNRNRTSADVTVFRKDKDIDALTAMDTLFKSNRPLDCGSALRLSLADTGIIPLMVFENYLDLADQHGEDGLAKAAAAIDDISASDLVEQHMYSKANFEMFDIHAAFAVVGPSMQVRTQSTHDTRFGCLLSKMSSSMVKKSQTNSLRDKLPGLWNVQDPAARYEYILLLRAIFEASMDTLASLRQVCQDPDVFTGVCRFGLRPPVISVTRLQGVAKKLAAHGLPMEK
jgi:hypothetical protein